MARPYFKLERAVRALLYLKGAGTPDNIFVGNDSRPRVLPNKTVMAIAQSNSFSYRPEGLVHFQIEHHVRGAANVGADPTVPGFSLDQFMATTEQVIFGFDSLAGASSGPQTLPGLANLITEAGRWLAQLPTVGAPDDTAANRQIAADNADMVNFRCDRVLLADPFMTRGRTEKDDGSMNWVEIFHLKAFCSESNGATT